MENTDFLPQNTEGVSEWTTNRLDLSRVSHAIEVVKKELSKIIVGQDELMDLLIAAILCDGHVLLEGVLALPKQ